MIALRRYLFLLVVLAWLATGFIASAVGKRAGIREAREACETATAQLEKAHANLRAQAAEQSLRAYQKEAARANEAERLLQQEQGEVKSLQSQLKERIPHVTTVYRASPTSTPVPIPRCVFTRGWVRDINAALTRTGLPTAATSANSTSATEAAGPAPGSTEELLESGVTPADILAFAQDYGRWSLANLALLHALQSLHKD